MEKAVTIFVLVICFGLSTMLSLLADYSETEGFRLRVTTFVWAVGIGVSLFGMYLWNRRSTSS